LVENHDVMFCSKVENRILSIKLATSQKVWGQFSNVMPLSIHKEIADFVNRLPEHY